MFCKAKQPLQPIELQQKEKSRDQKYIEKLVRKSPRIMKKASEDTGEGGDLPEGLSSKFDWSSYIISIAEGC